jgi:hypothetical protein
MDDFDISSRPLNIKVGPSEVVVSSHTQDAHLRVPFNTPWESPMENLENPREIMGLSMIYDL